MQSASFAVRQGRHQRKAFTKRSITADLAVKMIDAVIDKTKAISIEVAQNKAYTALMAPSQEFFEGIKMIWRWQPATAGLRPAAAHA